MRLNWIALPIVGLKTLYESGENTWNITKVGWGRDNTNHEIVNKNLLKVFYPRGSYTPSQYPQGGIGFYASPIDIFPCDIITFSYEVKFDETFQPNLGGKLPGLLLAEPGDLNYGSGGNKNNKTASVRIAWRKDFKAEVYVYVPEKQSIEYNKIENFKKNKGYGDSLWKGIFQFRQNEWNNIMIHIKLNSFDKYDLPMEDGVLKININGIEKIYDKMIWRIDNSTTITSILFSTFFGGSKPKYATPIDTWTYFKNFRVKN